MSLRSTVLAAISAFGVLGCGLLPPGLPGPVAETFVLPEVRLVEPARSRTGSVDLAVSSGLIRDSIPEESAAVLEEFRGATVLPGLMDLHTHMPPDTPLSLTEYFGLLYLAHGVTTVREAGDLDGTAIGAASRASAEGAPMPRVESCGPFVGGPDRRWANWIELRSPGDAPEVAAQLVAEGRVCVKVYDGLDEARVHAMVEATEAAGLVPIGHVPFGLTVEQARIPDTQHLMGVTPPSEIAAGDHVVHRIMDWRAVDEARIDAVAAASAELGLVHTPTLGLTYQLRHFQTYAQSVEDPDLRWMPGMYRKVVWHPSEGIYRSLTSDDFEMINEAWPKKLSLVRKLHEAGVPLRLGTDTQQPWVVPGASVWNELRHFVEAGIPADEALAYGTWRSGVGVGDPRRGELSSGAPADLLVFREDPTADLRALETLEAVVVSGKLYRHADLVSALEAWRDWYEGPLIDLVSRVVARRRMDDSITGEN